MARRNITFAHRAGRWFCTAVAAVLLAGMPLLAETVEVEGRAPGDEPAARSQALSDALREAVRTGAGVDLVSETQMKDFALDFDRTFSKARGYVKKYSVLSTGLDESGFYVVRIRADVGQGEADTNDKLTLQMMAREHEAPCVMIQIDEQIEGVHNGSLAADWLRQAATDCGLRVVEAGSAQGAGGMLAKRASTIGRGQEATLRSEGIVSACDYLIEGSVVGSSAGEESFYGSKPGKKYSLGLNLKVIDAATGVVIVTLNAPSRDILIRRVSSDTAAAREAVRQMMEGSAKVGDSDAGWKLIRRIFAYWAAEMDLGAVCKLEFTGLGLDKASALKDKLSSIQNVGSVWIRSIDPAGVSVIDCEARLNPLELAQIIEKSLPGYKLDRSEKRYLSFRYDAAAAAPQTAAAAEEESGISPYIFIGAGAGVLVLAALGLVLFLTTRKKAPQV